MGGLLGMGSQLLGGVVNDVSGSMATAGMQGESQGITDEANAGVDQNQGAVSQQNAASTQQGLNTSQAQVQGNEQNAAANNAQLGAVMQGNHILDQTKVAATLEKQREEGFNAALGAAS